MRQRLLSIPLSILLIAVPAASPAQDAHHHNTSVDAIATAVASPARDPKNRLRDQYRHPVETLGFFDVKPNQTLVEFLPGAGWYTEILAPFLKDKGHYIALVPSAEDAPTKAKAMLEKGGENYGRPTLATIDFENGSTTVPVGSVDRVLTFRNVHNLVMGGEQRPKLVFDAFFAMLKPGGVLGVVDHRLPETADATAEKTSGYVKRSTVIKLAESAGFKLASESVINANPKDTANWPQGVWTLPPTLALGDQDRAKYIAIGESDRMTLKFVKP
jgi:predicted methyltransferase